MRKENLFYLLGLSLSLALTGCVVRTYPLTKDRVDQDLTAGNRGYLQGTAPTGEQKERSATRTTQVVEIELHSPIKFEKAPKVKAPETTSSPLVEEKTMEGNRGYITQSITPEIAEPNLEKYTVQKNDTLQKISKKFYGTTKKWKKIYEANQSVLKGPDKVYPGQTLSIPVETLKEPKENLK